MSEKRFKCACTFDDEFDEWKLAVIKLLFNDDLIPIGFTKELEDDSIFINIQFKVK